MNKFMCALLGLTAFASPALAGCGDDADSCVIATGEYELALPDSDVSPLPLVMFLHGAGGTGANTMKNKRLINSLLARGYAVLAPTAQRNFHNGAGFVWNFRPGMEGRDETRFLQDVADDASERFDLDRDRILLSGFSAGGFMVNYLACDTPDAFAAYASVSGGFWRPHPDQCAGPVKLFHTHGWADKTVPLEGRFLGGGQFQQGDIFAGLEIWRTANECSDQRPDAYSETGEFWRRKWTECAPGSALELAMFPGGHQVPKGWGDMVLDWFEAEVK
jgi:polyhydroxybutyrate depolymerase